MHTSIGPGVDGYNGGTRNGGWHSFEQVFKNIYALLAAKKKPILIGELASSQAGGDKAKWIDEIIPTLRRSVPLIKGVVWLDINKEADWRISSFPESEAAFIHMMKDPYFNPLANSPGRYLFARRKTPHDFDKMSVQSKTIKPA
jgi:hypothetical protein